jgi:hypothetical protein
LPNRYRFAPDAADLRYIVCALCCALRAQSDTVGCLTAAPKAGPTTMWCSNCQQEVPGVANAVSGRTVCSRCQQPLRTKRADHAARVSDDGIALDEPAASVAAAARPLQRDDWANRQRVRSLGRELRRPSFATANRSSRDDSPARRFDPPHNLFEGIEQVTSPIATPASSQSAAVHSRSHTSQGTQIFSWLIVFAGALALISGIGLIAWSLTVEQMIYWDLALGLTLGGQGTLILGLVLVVSRLWRSSRHAVQKLQDVNARLGKLQHTADALAATRSGGAPAFYADLVRGASPQVLLANLKGQLDQLATRLSSGW